MCGVDLLVAKGLGAALWYYQKRIGVRFWAMGDDWEMCGVDLMVAKGLRAALWYYQKRIGVRFWAMG